MATQKRIDDYVSKLALKVASSVILIDSSENDEEDVIEYSENVRDVSASQPQTASLHEIELTDNATSEHDTDQSNCSSDERGDEECVDSNVEEDMNTRGVGRGGSKGSDEPPFKLDF